jgi:hypothetical protein
MILARILIKARLNNSKILFIVKIKKNIPAASLMQEVAGKSFGLSVSPQSGDRSKISLF